ncbi:hypothetical protein B0H11DRAFT_2281453 [Mycena galericulata]|nr:hypothetical protein B0H11DRAFT_2281453 [Mycena galericulata]
MPFFGRLGAAAALFRTYGIPSIAETLLRTGEMSGEATMTKRVTDANCDPYLILRRLSPSWPAGFLEACSSPNELDSWTYKISIEDTLYTMSVFIFQPTAFMSRFDWRPISPEELECLFILWKELGRRMRIYDILPTERGLKAWSEAYEREHMVPLETSRALAQIALNHIERRVPPLTGLRRLVTALFVCLMEERLRISMMCVSIQFSGHGSLFQISGSPPWAHRSVHVVCGVRAFFIRYFGFPHRRPNAYIAPRPATWGPTAVYGCTRLSAANFIRGITPSRGVYALGLRALWGQSKFPPEPAFKAEGCRMEELGPQRYEAEGHMRLFAEAEAMHGAPIGRGMPWTR